MVFNQKPRKPIMCTANAHKNAQGYCQPTKIQYVTNYHYIPMMKTTFIIYNFKISFRKKLALNLKLALATH